MLLILSIIVNYREDDDSYSDDDDVSWKVRRAAAKSLLAILTSRPDLLTEFYTVISPALIARFKGRFKNYHTPQHNYMIYFFRARRKC